MNRLLKQLAAALLLSAAGLALAAPEERNGDLLDPSAYRTELEEIVVKGRAPRWRDEQQRPELRPEDIQFFEPETQPRLQWLPRYTRDEREFYRGVRDRMDEKPQIKVFEIHF